MPVVRVRTVTDPSTSAVPQVDQSLDFVQTGRTIEVGACVTGNRKRNRPAITWMKRAASQWMRGSGVPPVIVVLGVGNQWVRAVTVFLHHLRQKRQSFRTSEALGDGRFERTHAFKIR